MTKYTTTNLRLPTATYEELRYEAYFLTVWDLVRFARQRGILCQGRGSAANSAVCYCLGVTSVDPARSDVLFERFVSRERNEAPDIDVDFEHERREEVLQYVYEKYGRDRAGIGAGIEDAIGPADARQAFDCGATPAAGRPSERERQRLFGVHRVAVRRDPQQALAPKRF